MQGWLLRRLVSVYNYLTRRPHVPRERVLRRIMRNQGLDVEVDKTPLGKPDGDGAMELEDSEDGDYECGEEGMEEEALTEDECA